MKTNANAYELIITMKKYKLKKITSIELITWNKHTSESTIDFTYATSLFRNNMIEIDIDENMNNHSNHRSIKTIFNLRTKTIASKITKIWTKTNIDILREKLQTKITNNETFIFNSDTYNNQTKKINDQVKKLIKII